ncbi:hypothetical protein [Cryobacterium roopkundense]|uniref:Uncharacterized protein n=1 Tax=Cryobacterium roopkundense TaxID=1001240 RepID=A0A7W9E4T6_9MICO|nr:hypothetical protein [Cryobacterium roopkundense]MBB5641784.1 hypothetical protein [Cryobacterium roopkundense]
MRGVRIELHDLVFTPAPCGATHDIQQSLGLDGFGYRRELHDLDGPALDDDAELPRPSNHCTREGADDEAPDAGVSGAAEVAIQDSRAHDFAFVVVLRL